jgi:hypothetical protein
MILVAEPTSLENVRALARLAQNIESYIGHESTARLLSELLGVEVPVSRGEFTPERGDVAVVVRLKRRLASPKDVKEITIDDVEFYVVNYEEDEVRD